MNKRQKYETFFYELLPEKITLPEIHGFYEAILGKRLVYWKLRQEISVQVLEGHIKFKTEQQGEELQKGQMFALKKQIPHSVLVLKETFFLLTMAMF